MGYKSLSDAAGLQKRPPTFDEQLQAMRGQIVRASKTIDPDRMIRVALTHIRNNPKLMEDPIGVLGAVMIASQLKLEFGTMGQCYMVPYGKKVQFVPGWMGWVDLVQRTGRAAVKSEAVYEGDEFDVTLGSKPFIHHKPDIKNWAEDRPLLYTYSRGVITGIDAEIFEVYGKRRLDAHLRSINRVGSSHYALKDSNNFEMWAKKVPLLQVVKYMPKSVEIQAASKLEFASHTPEGLGIEAAANILDTDYALPEPQAEAKVGEVVQGDAFEGDLK